MSPHQGEEQDVDQCCDHREAGCHENVGHPDPDCDHVWHVDRDHPNDACPRCGFSVDEEEDGEPWPAGVAIPEVDW